MFKFLDKRYLPHVQFTQASVSVSKHFFCRLDAFMRIRMQTGFILKAACSGNGGEGGG